MGQARLDGDPMILKTVLKTLLKVILKSSLLEG